MNTGGGGTGNQTAGGSGIVIIRYPNIYSVSIGAGLTSGGEQSTQGGAYKYIAFTAGTGTITFS